MNASKFKKLKLSNKSMLGICFLLFNALVHADNIDDFLLAKMKEKGIPGLQVSVIQNNRVVKAASYGTANVQHSVKVDDDTVFNIASMTKAFTCVAVMQLVEQGKIDLGATISTYMDDLPKSWQQITVNQILTHSSGLPDFMNERFQLINSEGEEQSWQAVQQRKMLFEPGAAFHYNQTNYLLAGQIIQRVSGKSYSDLIIEFQLKKVGMMRTEAAGFAHFEGVNLHQARDYRQNQQGNLSNVLTHFPSIIRAGAGMSSTANELAKWSIALQRGLFFDNKDSLEILWQEAPLSSDHWAKENPNMHPYALGWYKVNRPLNKKVVTAGGGQSALAVYPDDDISIVLLTNLAGSKPENLMDELAEFYLDDFALSPDIKLLKQKLEQKGYDNALDLAKKLVTEGQINFEAGELHHFAKLLVKHNKKQQAKTIFSLNNQLFSKVILNKEKLDEYVGDYELADFSINVSRNADALFITATGDTTLPIFSVTDSRFVLKQIDAAITFVKDESGSVNKLILNLNNQDLTGKKIKN
ncbi:serine hydrolase [Alteromonas pelagimontana]|uniref:Serine hydrolase n=1 Tax=Alteromonas pelagimontana TaxID=1858656 RepID=A0A6M4MEB6_9ALTE|nr:serine hydrolase [Alteromonas pelagimontana]QJR81198.1 serine hydrolase [Alteromonas pelagimontana]